ncbi:glycoside hydrolase family 13 protein [Xylona heveae TC161]|uniref:Glycoside hydrolase family 13 protein n=1 Tax=Xylona heveae (strain CBS 132557 / TC161) TaxID=1328760 RepID=A0A165IYG7_XYLHT|nr:glycoside hydrolase family 13 protein [Xylona heveae TC161]KZF25551.1 glycoside hydrolase family 13 protein [Xylona heveae TC161]
MVKMLSYPAWVASLLALPLYTLAASTDEWKSRTIYQALTDRIAGGVNACGDLGEYCGGTWSGLSSKLDYIQGMGFNAIWISPIVDNHPAGYHGYWTQDLNSINSNFGSQADLEDLVQNAHNRGMFVMIDTVVNDMGSPYSENSPSLLSQDSSYHQYCLTAPNDDNQTQVEDCWLANNLPDLVTTNSQIRSTFQTWVKGTMATYEIDGLRIDAANHVEMDYWTDFLSAAGNPYADPTTLGTFIDNHDNPRFLNQQPDTSLLKSALAYVVLGRGIPIIYYGTEQGFNGGANPANREDLWPTGYPTNGDIYQHISKLTYARNSLGGLPNNDHVHLYNTDTVYAWSRANGKLIVLTSNQGSSYSGSTCFNTNMPQGTNYQSVFDSNTYQVQSGGTICVSLYEGLPEALLQQ